MITKELFVESLEAMRVQLNEDIKNADLIKEAFNIKDFVLYDNMKLNNAIMKMMCQGTKDKRDCFIEIEHYCFVCDFGKCGDEYEEPEQLYERLIKN